MARPCKLTSRMVIEFRTRIQMGTSIKTACKITGIHEDTYYQWAKEVKTGKTRGAVGGLKKQLIEEVDVAMAEAKCLAEAGVMAAGQKNWTAHAWWLERRYPEEYALKREASADPMAPKVTGARFTLWGSPTKKPEKESSSTEASTDTTPSHPSSDST